jgi:two-component system LytT family response regulator
VYKNDFDKMKKSTILRSIIIDESMLAINDLYNTLEQYFHTEIFVVKKYTNPLKALEDLDKVMPDVIFLELQFSDFNSFKLYDILSNKFKSKVVIYSGLSELAVKVLNNMVALGFVSKPIELQQIRVSIDRALLKRENNNYGNISKQIYPDFILLNNQAKIILLPVKEIKRLLAEGAYTLLYYGGTHIKISKNLKYFENRLDPSIFLRVDRSNIIRFDSIKEMSKQGFDNKLIMTDGHVIRLSKIKLASFIQILDNMKLFAHIYE